MEIIGADGVEFMKNILITGASGFLGYNLCRDLGNKHRVFATRHRQSISAEVIDSCRWDLTGSVKPLDTWIQAVGIDAIVHCAAISKPAQCAADPKLARIVNVDATRDLGALAAKHKTAFVFMSTDLVYNSGPGPHLEDDADPHLVYSETKFDAEMELFMACPSSIVLRSALVLGSDDGFRGSVLRENYTNLRQGKHLKLFTDQYRSPIWSRDIADAIDRILTRGLHSQVYNIGGSTRINRYDLGMMAAEAFNWDKSMILPVPMETMISNAHCFKDCSLNSSRLERDTGWKATSLSRALKEVAAEWTQPVFKK
jgi:dTDP-4-dehydrorhamnose reductase